MTVDGCTAGKGEYGFLTRENRFKRFRCAEVGIG